MEQHLQPNTTLQGGKYRIERVLGQGGFGITYLATQVSENKRVAIKELFVAPSGQVINSRQGSQVIVTNAANQVSFGKHKEKFKKEASRLTTLHHQNLVRVYECFEENGTVYYVMDFIEGESLRAKLNRTGALSESLVTSYLSQLLSALEVVHRQKIWHLDIKPENIMVDNANHIYLIDFGASKHIEQTAGTLTTSSMLSHTPGYYPPEQSTATMRNIGAWTDIYALGATIYNLLTRKTPPTFDVIISEGRKAFSFPATTSSQLQDLVVWMMKVNRNERPQGVPEILMRLEGKYSQTVVEDESTIIAGTTSRSFHQDSEETIVSRATSSTSSSEPSRANDSGGSSPIGWIIGIAALLLLGFFFLRNNDVENTSIPSTQVGNQVENQAVNSQNASASETAIVDENQMYKERVQEFAERQKNVIASFPSDNRFCVYYLKADEYSRKFLYRYDAISDKSSKIDLPIEATSGDVTSTWFTKGRYIFVAATYRYTDFIRVDTKTNQVMYITDCDKVKRSQTGFVVTKSEIINEYSAQSSADYEYAYTDYYYDEEGNYKGQGNQYR